MTWKAEIDQKVKIMTLKSRNYIWADYISQHAPIAPAPRSSSPNGRAAEEAAGSGKLPFWGWKVTHSRTEPTQTPGLSMICGRKASEHPRTRTSDPVRPPDRPSVCYWHTHVHTHTSVSGVVVVVALCCVGSVHPAVIRACLDGYVTHTHTHARARHSGFWFWFWFWSRIMMENPQKAGPLPRDLTRTFSHYNKHNLLLKKNLKETIIFFREIRQNHSNTCSTSTSGPELDSGQAGSVHWSHDSSYLCLISNTIIHDRKQLNNSE